MNVKVSVTIDEETLRKVDSYVDEKTSRSAIFREAIEQWLARRRQPERR